MYSEKELIREIEKIASTLVPEKDWSLRIAGMQRVEALVFGGLKFFFYCYSAFHYIVHVYAHKIILNINNSNFVV